MKRLTYILTAFAAALALPAHAETSNCTVIDTIPIIIDQQGIYCLKGNLSSNAASGNLIEIQTNNVTIDFNGYKLGGLGAGDTTQAFGIRAQDRRNISIRNGAIRGFRAGIMLAGGVDTSSGHVIEDMLLDGNRVDGILAFGTGITIRNNRIVNTGNHATQTSANGIYGTLVESAIIDNVISNVDQSGGAFGLFLVAPSLVEIAGNTISGVTAPSTAGIVYFNSSALTIRNNLVTNPISTPGVRGLSDGLSSRESVLCIDNTIANFTMPVAGCDFESGTVTPP